MTIAALLAAYRRGALDPWEVVGRARARAAAAGAPAWISVISTARLEERLAALGDPQAPLHGIPFAVKDNIDAAGLPTTAGCPAFARAPGESAHAVALLEAAGAVVIGKTNLDQFATGLTGSRSPYGACASVVDPRYVSGGSSSGSAVVVADGTVPFALGTDTAGSGRVPAAFNEIVGFKPTRGAVSVRGVVPACRSLDCVSVFARTVRDAATVFGVIAQPDAADPLSREVAPLPLVGGREAATRQVTGGLAPAAAGARRAVPAARQVAGGLAPAAVGARLAVPAAPRFFGDDAARRAWDTVLERVGPVAEFDFAPFAEAAALLYDGPWIAERYASVGAFVEAHPGEVDPTVARIITAGRDRSAAELFAAQHRLAELQAIVVPVLAGHDALLFPTAPTHPTLAAVAAAPVARNAELGTYTNFANLLDLSAIAIPARRRDDGLPFGVTLMAPAGGDERLLALARRVMDHVADLPALRADHREAAVLDDRVEARVPEHL